MYIYKSVVVIVFYIVSYVHKKLNKNNKYYIVFNRHDTVEVMTVVGQYGEWWIVTSRALTIWILNPKALAFSHL